MSRLMARLSSTAAASSPSIITIAPLPECKPRSEPTSRCAFFSPYPLPLLVKVTAMDTTPILSAAILFLLVLFAFIFILILTIFFIVVVVVKSGFFVSSSLIGLPFFFSL